jgi:hypothetical protein
MTDNDFLWMLDWYHGHCNGDWEHEFGVHIKTIDNLGWFLEICLEYTELHDVEFEKFELENSNHDWLYCVVKDNKFLGSCGPGNLPQVLHVFREWAESHQDENKYYSII